MRKSIAAAAMAASLTVGGAAGVAIFTPTLSGATQTAENTVQTDTGQASDTDHPRLENWLDDALTPLVPGTINADQKEAVISAIESAAPERPPRPGFGLRGDMADAVAQALGMTTDELRQAHQDGQTLADIADAEGVDQQVVVDAIVATINEHLDQAVTDGRLTQEQADQMKANAADRAQDILNGTAPDGDGPRGRFGPGPHGGPGGPFGPGFDEDTSGS